MNEDLFDAFQRIWQDPATGDYRIQLGQERQFRQTLSNVVREFGIDRDKYRITDRGLFRAFRNILLEIAEEQGVDIGASELNRRFETKKGELFSNWLGQPPNEYTVVFPLMIRSQHFPDTIELSESRADQIEFVIWNEEYLSVAVSSDKSNFEAFLDELPNDYSDDFLARREWSYFTVEFEARDEFYALFRVMDLVEIRLAEINFFDNLWSAGMPQPASSNRPPYERWSRLQVPQFYLLFHESDFINYWGIDYDYRRSAGMLHFHEADVGSISEIPTFDYSADKNSFEGHIVSALLAYQDGITERSVRQSFFSFWRGVEILSNTSNFGKMVDRGKFSISYHRGPDSSLRPSLQTAMRELVDVRHQLVHEGLKTGVQRRHQNGAKLLLDGLLLLYIEHFDAWTLDDVGTFLKYGSQYEDQLLFISNLIKQISDIQS